MKVAHVRALAIQHDPNVDQCRIRSFYLKRNHKNYKLNVTMHLCHMKMRMTNDYTEIIYFDVRLGCQKMTRPCIIKFFLAHTMKSSSKQTNIGKWLHTSIGMQNISQNILVKIIWCVIGLHPNVTQITQIDLNTNERQPGH